MWPFDRKKTVQKTELYKIKDVLTPLIQKGIIGNIPDAVMLEVFSPGDFANGRSDVWIASDSLIARDVKLTGPCAIGKGSNIAKKCKIGPDVFIQLSEIGESCKVLDSYIVQSKLIRNVEVKGSNIINSAVFEGNKIIKKRLKDTIIPEERFT